nr:coordinator of PRMT5 and differentiation stimulator isoform X3 [Anser cygnoides]
MPLVMAASLECINFEEEQLPDKRETMNWKPRKVKPIILGQTKADECLRKNIPRILDSDSEESEFSAISPYEDDVSRSPVGYYVQPDLEDLDGEISNMLENVTSPEQQTALVYEVEDWDKELEDSESNPYGIQRAQEGSGHAQPVLAFGRRGGASSSPGTSLGVSTGGAPGGAASGEKAWAELFHISCLSVRLSDERACVFDTFESALCCGVG